MNTLGIIGIIVLAALFPATLLLSEYLAHRRYLAYLQNRRAS